MLLKRWESTVFTYIREIPGQLVQRTHLPPLLSFPNNKVLKMYTWAKPKISHDTHVSNVIDIKLLPFSVRTISQKHELGFSPKFRNKFDTSQGWSRYVTNISSFGIFFLHYPKDVTQNASYKFFICLVNFDLSLVYPSHLEVLRSEL